MALELKHNFKGVDCDYWRIEKMEAYYRNGVVGEDKFTTMHVSIVLYQDKVSRMANVKNWLMIKQYVFPHHITTGVKPNEVITEYTPTDDSRAAVYACLKTLPEFIGAVDD